MKLFVSFNFFSIMLDLASLTDAWGESVLYRIKSLFINFGGAWSKQELFKGCSLWTGGNTFTFAGAAVSFFRPYRNRIFNLNAPDGVAVFRFRRCFFWYNIYLLW